MPIEDRAAIRAELVEAVVAAMLRQSDRFRPSDVVTKFADRGVHRATLYRWIDAAKASGQIGRAITNALDQAAADRPAELDAADVVANAPPHRVLEQIAGPSSDSVLSRLRRAMDTAEDVMAHARDAEGKPRAAKLLLLAGENLRRCVETSARLAEKFHEYQRVEQFQRAVIEEIRKESPACAARTLERLDTLTQQWGAT